MTMVLERLVTPVCVLVALSNGVLTERAVSTIFTIFLIVIVPWEFCRLWRGSVLPIPLRHCPFAFDARTESHTQQ